MSASRSVTDSGISGTLPLSEASFQKLLAAAWVIQCQREHAARDISPLQAATCADQERSLANVLHARIAAFDANADVHIERSPADPIEAVPAAPKLRPSRVEPDPALAEISGALALLPDRPFPPTSPPSPLVDSELQKSAGGKQALGHSRQRPGLRIVTFKASDRTEVKAIRFLRSSPGALLVGAVALLLALTAFVTVQLVRHDVVVTSVHASPEIENPVTAAPNKEPSPPLVATSHLQVTDPSISSELEDLSRFEMRILRRQAQYGDEQAALILGIAYEKGKGVPQNCAEAAHWISISAEDGSAAAQYNLGLRYLQADGLSANDGEARKWLQEAANQGYEKARVALKLLR
jgi:Sel1 repeat-containing protein